MGRIRLWSDAARFCRYATAILAIPKHSAAAIPEMQSDSACFTLDSNSANKAPSDSPESEGAFQRNCSNAF